MTIDKYHLKGCGNTILEEITEYQKIKQIKFFNYGFFLKNFVAIGSYPTAISENG